MSGFSNNLVNANGEQFIPASQRPDGTWRKARRVKDGYVPQEEVPLYESKGKQVMTKNQQAILPSGKIVQKLIPGLCIVQDEEKRKSKRKNKKNVTEINNQFGKMTITTNSENRNCSEDVVDSDKISQDLTKKLKNLRKKVREIECLEEKLKNGLISKPEPEQMSKIKKKK
ncbi:hypothetical protein NQ317_017269 [Molorchus minor]|uniref:Partner of Y14 and mago n=1 Tax=Molorchus minor TaxID=1323400 RepID=A0ABQ9JTM9_9CUCU|nr:hypothetical protein NQ317_017269 [Molorchus minor]